jgi:hypothetical protein
MIAHPGISGIIYRRTPPLRKNPQNLGYNWGFWGTMPQLLEDSNEALDHFLCDEILSWFQYILPCPTWLLVVYYGLRACSRQPSLPIKVR